MVYCNYGSSQNNYTVSSRRNNTYLHSLDRGVIFYKPHKNLHLNLVCMFVSHNNSYKFYSTSIYFRHKLQEYRRYLVEYNVYSVLTVQTNFTQPLTRHLLTELDPVSWLMLLSSVNSSCHMRRTRRNSWRWSHWRCCWSWWRSGSYIGRFLHWWRGDPVSDSVGECL